MINKILIFFVLLLGCSDNNNQNFDILNKNFNEWYKSTHNDEIFINNFDITLRNEFIQDLKRFEFEFSQISQNNLKTDDIDWGIPHQANKRIMDLTAKKLKIPSKKILMTIDNHANTSSASIPLTLDSALSKKIIKRKQLILLEAIGGGLTSGCSLIKF